MKNFELYTLKKAIDKCSDLQGAKFTYGLNKNLVKINSEIEVIEKSKHTPSDKLKAYTEEEKKLVEKHAKKDENGGFVIENGQYTFTDKSVKALNKELKALKEKHPEAMEEIKKSNEDFEKLLNAEANIELFKIKTEDVDNKITSEQMKGIFCLIE